jgi:Amt family ammonium transporter
MCLVTVQWFLFGYSLSFGPDVGHLIGNLDWSFLRGVGVAPDPDYASTVPHLAFMAFQLKFAIITPALIIGAYAERMKFSTFCVFTFLWATLVYCPITHWIWGKGGFLKEMGAMDFAGGAVVHISAGMAALAAALVLGKRVGKSSPPHSLPLAILGAGMLWFGWFGFNAGSALAANGQAATAFVNTHISGAFAGLAWSLFDWFYHKRATTLGMITGVVAGLAAVTPGAGLVTPVGAMCIGLGSAAICFISVTFIKARFGYDDTLDAFGVHGVGGIWGTIATGIWCVGGAPDQFMVQVKTTLVTGVFAFVVSYALLKILDYTMGLRVTEHDERIGLDLTQHRETAYTLLD